MKRKNLKLRYLFQLFVLFSTFLNFGIYDNAKSEIPPGTKIICTDSLFTGISNAVVFNGEICVVVGSDPKDHFPGYADPNTKFCKLTAISETKVLLPLETTSAADAPHYCDIALTDEGYLAIVYSAPEGYLYGFRAPYKIFDGEKLILNEVLYNKANYGAWNQLEIGNDNKPRVTSFAHNNYRLKYFIRDNNVWKMTDITPSMNYVGELQATINQNNEFHISGKYGYDLQTRTLRHYWNDGTWHEEIVVNSQITGNCDIQFSKTGDIFILYTQAGLLKLARKSGSWFFETVVTQDTIGYRASIIFAPDNTPHVVYQTPTKLVVLKKENEIWKSIFEHKNLKIGWTGQPPSLLYKNSNLYVVYTDKYNVYMNNLNANASISLAIGKVVGTFGDTVMVPIHATFPQNFSCSSAEIALNGFQGKLNFLGVVTDSSLIGEAGWSVVVNENDSLLITVAAGAKDISGSGNLLWLKFLIPETADTGFIPIKLKSALFNNGEVPVELISGGVDVQYDIWYGDVDLNHQIRAYDAALILKYLVGQTTLTHKQLLNANVSLDTTISSLDATLILQYVAGLIDSLPHTASAASFIATGEIGMEDREVSPGKIVEIPLTFSNGNNIFSFYGEITFNNLHLSFNEIAWSSVLKNFDIEVNENNGIIKFAGASRLTDGSNGVLGTLHFLVNDKFLDKSTVIAVDKFRWNENVFMKNVAQSTLSLVTNVNKFGNQLPTKFELQQNYPNPFNPSTSIHYAIPKPGFVMLVVYDLLGKEIEQLVFKRQSAGEYAVQWSAANLPNGIYVYQLMVGDVVMTRKAILMK